MRKTRFLCLMLALMILMGTAVHAGAEGLFDFAFPKEYFIPEETITDSECSIILRNVGRVGGIRVTDLGKDVPLNFLTDYNAEPIADYFRNFTPEGYDFGYFVSCGNLLEAEYILVNLTTMEQREFKHYFFEKEGKLCDLWLNSRYLNSRDMAEILVSTGIEPKAKDFLLPEEEKEPDYDVSIPEGCTLGQPGEDGCPLLRDGEIIGGVRCTDISPDAFCQWENDSFWDLAPVRENGTSNEDDSPCEFAVVRWFAKFVPEDCFFEYMLMHWDGENPTVGATFAVTNGETGERTETSHTYFEHDGMIYELWQSREMEFDSPDSAIAAF